VNEIVESPFGNRVAQSSGSRQLQARENTEVMAMAMMAKRFPRDQVAACDRIRNAFTRTTLAERAQYQFARGGTDITGASIRAAEAIGQQWGNLASGWREVSRTVDSDGVGQSEVEAYCTDYESTNRESIQFFVRHWRDTKKGGYKLTDERDIYELCANQAARRKRACILAMIPGDIVEMAMDQASVTLKSSADTSPEAMAKLVAAFEPFGITKAMIETRIQRRLDSIQAAQVVGLRRIYASLRDEMSTPADWFPVAGEAADATGLDAVRAAAAAPVAPARKRAPKPEADPATGEVAAPTPQPPVAAAPTAPPRPAPGQAFDEEAIARRLQASTEVELLDMLADELLRDVPAGAIRDRLNEVYHVHRGAIS